VTTVVMKNWEPLLRGLLALLHIERLGGVSLRVGTSVGHGEESRLGVELLEVLIGELLTVDGLATSALYHCELRFIWGRCLGGVRCHG
jgi:hypothetical protein